MTKKYIYGFGLDNPIVMINVSDTTETWYYYYTDALGSIRLITDHTGDIKESYVYDPFGRPRVMTGSGSDSNWLTEDATLILSYSPLGNPYMFTARRWDPSANLYYYRFRDYQPDLGRFCQPDPLHYIDGMNLYAYCNNNPLNWLDPWGLDAKNEEDNPLGKHHDLQETLDILDEVQRLGWHPFQHRLGARYDFVANGQIWDTFTVMINGQEVIMTSSQFGNYLGGFAGTYNMGLGGYLGMRLAGNWYARGNIFKGEDEESIKDINQGAKDAIKERVIEEIIDIIIRIPF